MELKLTPDLEDAIIKLAQKVKGARGGMVKSDKKARASRRNLKLGRQVQSAASAAA